MAPQPPPPQEPASSFSSSTTSSRSRPSRTSSSSSQPTTTPLPLNTTSLHVDTSYTASPSSSTVALAATETSTVDGTSNSDSSPALAVSIVIIALVIGAVLALTALFIYLYRRRRRRTAPTPRPRPNVLRRPESRKRSRRPSDFWSADASKPPSTFGISPRSPNEHAGLLGQEQQEIREVTGGQRESMIVAGSSELRAPSPIGLQLPTPTHQPEHGVWDRSTDVEQQMPPVEGQGSMQPRISESEMYFYPYEPSQRSARNSTSTVHSRSLLSPVTADEPAYSSSNLEQRPTSSSRFTSSSISSRHQSSEPFGLDNLVLGSPTTLSRAQSPSQPSTRSSIDALQSLSGFPLPPTRQHTLQSPESVLRIPLPTGPQPPQPALQSDISQTLASLRRSPSQTTYLQRNTSSASTVASRRPRLGIITDDMRHPPTSFSAGYYMYASPENERPNLPRAVSEAPSVESVYSTPDEPPP